MRSAFSLQGLLILSSVLATAAGLSAQTPNLCGRVVEESQMQVAEAQVELTPVGATEAVAVASTDARGVFCFTVAEGSYRLKVAKKPWPDQPPHAAEVQAGNTTVVKIELEYEPGEPRARFEESLDGMDPGARRALVEQLLVAGDSASLHELARRLVPKRSVGIELSRLTRGLPTQKLVQELLRYLERGYLPPLKTARFLHALGEVSEPGHERIIPLLLRKLTDGRRLPPGSYVTWSGLYDSARQYYVSDEAALALTKITGRDFKYQLGRPPFRNQRAIANAREWWRNEQTKKQEQQRGRRRP
ncbi:MAG: carboxypeptidase-like regulatory domain-containing protein [Terriglobia bacterium]